ncbi:hypothetical protein GsuE55_16200 [Geobacillus subterraneus]|uniref:Uncharacterized protein n=1 Tax=Geobacillus subterraneus TaxID=129338 RepID=A0A679FRA7_9BACL|nr:hypothetical protein GsuE55_16200 [Geobacillus subterraneus]
MSHHAKGNEKRSRKTQERGRLTVFAKTSGSQMKRSARRTPPCGPFPTDAKRRQAHVNT